MQPIDVYGALVKQQHALNETIAPLEKTSQASAAHSVGTQLIYNGVLYDVTTNIAVGDTLTVGTNISVADDITTQISSVNTALTNLNDTVVQNGAHNLLPLTLANLKSANTSGTWSDNVYTFKEITYTVNLDDNDNVESILVNGTSTGTSLLTVGEIELDNGTYYINGTPSGASVAGYSTLIQVYNGSSWTDVYCLSQNVFTVTNRKIRAYVARVASGTTVSGVYYYPMIRLYIDKDTTYTPYAMTNQELTSKVAPIACDKTSAGTYTLSATVDSDGNVSYLWN